MAVIRRIGSEVRRLCGISGLDSPVRRRSLNTRLSLEPLEIRRMLTATVMDDYASATSAVQAAIDDGDLVVDPSDFTVTSVPGVDPSAVNVDRAGEIESYLYVDSLDESVLQSITDAGGRVTGTDPYSMAVNVWVKPATVPVLQAVSDVSSIALPVLSVTSDPVPLPAAPITSTLQFADTNTGTVDSGDAGDPVNAPSVSDDSQYDAMSQLLPAADRFARISLRAVDMDGNPISSVQVGQQFRVEEYVTDTSAKPDGVFAAFNNLNFDPALASPSGPVSFPASYPITFPGDAARGVLDPGAILALGFTDGNDWKLFTATFTANSAGQLSITTSADGLLGHDLLEFDTDDPVPTSHIDFGSLNLTITNPPAGNPGGTSGAPVGSGVTPDPVGAPHAPSTDPSGPGASPLAPIGTGSTDHSVSVNLRAIDMDGNPITSIQVGQQFRVEEYVTDTSANPGGVYSFYNELNYDSALASSSGTITFPAEYARYTVPFTGNAAAGALDAGAFRSFNFTGGRDWQLFTATFIANAAGQFSISTAADGLAGHDLFAFGSPFAPITNIDFGSLNLTIVNPPTINPPSVNSGGTPGSSLENGAPVEPAGQPPATVANPASASLNPVSLIGAIANPRTSNVLPANTTATSISLVAANVTLSLPSDALAGYQQVLHNLANDNSASSPSAEIGTTAFAGNDGAQDGDMAVSTIGIRFRGHR
jgi:hypothetical protein